MAHAHHSEDRDGVAGREPGSYPDSPSVALRAQKQDRLAAFLAQARPDSPPGEPAELTIAPDLNYLSLFLPESTIPDDGNVEEPDWALAFASESELPRAATASSRGRRIAAPWMRTGAPIAAVLLLGTVAGVWGARDDRPPSADTSLESPSALAPQTSDAGAAASPALLREPPDDGLAPATAPVAAPALPAAVRNESVATDEAAVVVPPTDVSEAVPATAERAELGETSPPVLLSAVGAPRMVDLRPLAVVPAELPLLTATEPLVEGADTPVMSGSEGETAVGTNVPVATGAPVDVGITAAEVEVRQTIRSYQDAYAGMDVSATAEVWPSVDRRSLARAFDALRSQGLTFENCNIAVTGSSATAKCRGTLQIVRKVGSPLPLTSEHEWIFTMRRVDGDWTIDEVAVLQISTAPQG